MDQDITWIAPQTPIPEQDIELPSSDQISVRGILARCMCFTTNSEFPKSDLERVLKDAVAATLAEMPFLAGRVEWANEQKSRIKVRIPKNATVPIRIKDLPFPFLALP